MENLPLNKNNTRVNTEKQLHIAGLYARVSTGRQEKEETIDSQVAEIKDKIQQDELVLPEKNIFIDDGWTGTVLARPSLDRLRDSIKNEELDVLYVYDLGRLSREYVDLLYVMNEIKRQGVKLISLHDINANTPEQQLAQRVMSLFHDYERIKIAERFRRGKLHKARQGIIISGHAKYGWKYIPKNGDQPAKIIINEEEARVVRMIWRWFGEDHLSKYKIIDKLYELGIPPRRRKSKHWTKGPVDRLLRCESYVTGILYYNKTKAVVPKYPRKKKKYKRVKKTSRVKRPKEEWIPYEVEPIIKDYDLYLKVKRRLEYYKKYANKKRKYDYLLSGLVKCGCGKIRAGDGCSKNGHYYYRCAERIKRYPKKERTCHIKAANAQVLDKMVWKNLVKYLTQPELIKKEAESWLKSQKDKKAEVRQEKKLKEVLAKIKREEERYTKAYGSGTLEFDQYQEMMKQVKRRKKGVEKQLEDLAKKKSRKLTGVEVDELYKEAKKVLKTINKKKKREIVYDIIEKVIVKERRKVEVWAHIPLPATLKLGYESERRDSRTSKCREINTF